MGAGEGLNAIEGGEGLNTPHPSFSSLPFLPVLTLSVSLTHRM